MSEFYVFFNNSIESENSGDFFNNKFIVIILFIIDNIWTPYSQFSIM
jgi:hypothetical protein